MRNKISAADLLSAESILEVHREKNGEDSAYLNGLGWLARGALLMGDWEKAAKYAAAVRAGCAEKIKKGVDLVKDHDVEIAFGAAIEVQAQLMAREKGAAQAADFVRAELAQVKGPLQLRMRLNKRIDLLTLTGQPAPELVVEDFVGERPPTLASLRGKPVLLFLWAEWCADCKAQAPVLARVKSRYAAQGLQLMAVTRYYQADSARVSEKARVDSVWKAVYADVGSVPMVFSNASVERYGSSSTPTFVFVDRKGVVSRYTPTRLTEAEFDRTLAAIAR